MATTEQESPRPPLSPHARAGIIGDIKDYLHDLTVDYNPHNERRRKQDRHPLLQHLDALGTGLVLQRMGDNDHRGGKPGSRQPSSSHIDHAARIRKEAICWDQILRRSTVARPAHDALNALVSNADLATDELLRELKNDIRMWHTTAAILCGYLDAERDLPHHYPEAKCMSCDTNDIWAIASERTGKCRTCGETYDPTRLLNLLKAAQ